MKVDFFDVKRQYKKIEKEIENSVIKVLRSGQFINGPICDEFEKKMSNYLNVKHVITNGNGTDSLVIALKALGIKNGDEVLTTPFSFFATAEAIASVGAIPVFVDIKKDNYTINPELIEEKITDKTKAILPVHIFGHTCDMDKINEIAKKHNLYVIEDACQSIGSTLEGRKSGSLGDIACFSFYPTKNLGCCGDGGMITTNNDELAVICKALKSHGAGKIGCEARKILYKESNEIISSQKATELYDPYKYYNYLIGCNSRLDSVQAAILNVKLKYLDEYNDKRRSIAKKYTNDFSNCKKIICPKYDEECVYHQYVLLADDKDKLINYLNNKGIGAGNFYPVSLHLQKAFSYLNYKECDYPISEEVSNHSVCLPIFPELKDEEIAYIVKCVKEYEEE